MNEKKRDSPLDASDENSIVSEINYRLQGVANDATNSATECAVLIVSGHQPPSLATLNNNSFCHAIQSSPAHAHLCEPYCGKAFYRALEKDKPDEYRCHAGLNCVVPRLEPIGGRKLAAIVGRAFESSADYEKLERRVNLGDLRALASGSLFDRVHFTSHDHIRETARHVADLMSERETANRQTQSDAFSVAADNEKPPFGLTNHETQVVYMPDSINEKDSLSTTDDATNEQENETRETNVTDDDLTSSIQLAAVSPHSSLAQLLLSANMKLKAACRLVLDALTVTHGIRSSSISIRFNGAFTHIASTNEDLSVLLPPGFDANHELVVEAVRQSAGLQINRISEVGQVALRFSLQTPATPENEDANKFVEGAAKLNSLPDNNKLNDDAAPSRAAEMFMLVAGNEARGCLIISDELSDEKRRVITSFCREIALPIEVLRLREEVEQGGLLFTQLKTFTEQVGLANPEEAFTAVLNYSAELLQAERSSLLIYDESSNELTVRAATGPRAEVARQSRLRLGDAVSGAVLQQGRPLVVRDVRAGGNRNPAAEERLYKTDSFISLPIIIGNRRVGVINVTDRTGGESYDELDLKVLQMMTPQIALAIERAEWHQKASRFRQLSITDSLTNLLNRRYLEERLAEEVERTKRTGANMSFMMIDIDDFKLYNDSNGHQAGDAALELTAQNLKSALRAADVAARYGGEEFSVLLPQTSIAEAEVIAERIRRRIERTRYPQGHTQPLGAVTVSIGISTFAPEADSPQAIIAHADQALYVAKHLGKNRVQLAPSAAS